METGTKFHHIHSLPLLILAMLVNILSQAAHETGHHMVYQIMGRDPVWGFTKLVQIWETIPMHPNEWVETEGPEGERGWLKLSSAVESDIEKFFNTVAGPLAGLFSAALGLFIARRSKNNTWKQVGLAYTLSASLVAILYYLRSPMRSGGDEYVIAMFLGVPKLAIEIILALGFVTCLSFALRELPSWRIRLSWLGIIFLGAVVTGLLMAISPLRFRSWN